MDCLHPSKFSLLDARTEAFQFPSGSCCWQPPSRVPLIPTSRFVELPKREFTKAACAQFFFYNDLVPSPEMQAVDLWSLGCTMSPFGKKQLAIAVCFCQIVLMAL